MGFHCGSVVNNPPANEGDVGPIPGLGRSPRVGNGNTLQYSCLENPIDLEVWQAIVNEVTRVGHNLAMKQQFLVCLFQILHDQ